MTAVTATKATHTRNKTKESVIVTREYNIVVVRNMRGKVIGSYEPVDMAKFYKRYTKITVKGR